MTTRSANETNESTLGQLIVHIKDEGRHFLQTRLETLVSELQENTSGSRRAAMFTMAAVVLLGTAYLLFVLFLAGIVAVAFAGNPYAWSFGLLIVGFTLAMLGIMCALGAKGDFHGLLPKRTIQVLKDDTVLLKHETQSEA